jgi:hypothetical protein
LPAEAQAQMKSVFAKQQNTTVDHCVTPEEARQPAGKFFTGKEADNCRYERFTMRGGKIDAVMRCTDDRSASATMTMTVSGTYTPESSNTRSDMQIDGGPQGSMRIKAVSEAKRAGECTGPKSG